ncbi:oxidoreductase [Chimaeribacter coloradensis]|uniref:Oxidoreductase n=1 Tax=Chimaeribacter coloradensis TaxID=2060068 RepID=A0A2N5DW00_9GAMM|nr:Gfo/Idh/MocA family oxidoreductase [Chimaeribacter coloradensis]PLR31316.1 oxidoreductase [Chimaeribacter coloradensis]
MLTTSLPRPRPVAPGPLPTLRWGIIGPGWIAERFTEALCRHTQQNVVAVAGRTKEKAARFAEKWAIPKVCDDIAALLALKEVDAVYIATPHNHHFPDGLHALRAGKHVLIEKPLALNAQEGRALQAEAQVQKRFCMEAMWCDFTPKYDVLTQLLEQGELGELHTLIADHGEFFTPDHRIFNPDLAGGPMLDLGSYLVAFSVKVGNGAPDTICARGQAAPGGVNGQASMLFTHAKGLHSVLNTTLFSSTPGTAVIAGRKARLVLDGHFYAPGNFTLTANQGGNTLHWQDEGHHYAQLRYEAEHVAWCVGQGLTESPIRPLATTLTTLTVMDEVRRQLGIVFNEEREPRIV